MYYITLTKTDCQLTSEMSLVKMIILLLKKIPWPISGFPWPSMTTVIFHDFTGMENSFLKFHEFPDCVRTLFSLFESGEE